MNLINKIIILSGQIHFSYFLFLSWNRTFLQLPQFISPQKYLKNILFFLHFPIFMAISVFPHYHLVIKGNQAINRWTIRVAELMG